MLTERGNRLSRLLADSQDRRGICMQLLLTWLMSADGTVTDRELDFFDEAAPPTKDSAYLQEFIFMCEEGKYLEIQLACEFLRKDLNARARREFLRLAVGMITVDGRYTPMERYILEFLADLFEVPREELSAMGTELMNANAPAKGDPSTRDWWQKNEEEYRRQRRTLGNEGSRTRKLRLGTDAMDRPQDRQTLLRARACAILGLPSDANKDQIRMAYRRLAQIHHPDRFDRLGPEAVQVAHETFNRIRKAMEFLLND